MQTHAHWGPLQDFPHTLFSASDSESLLRGPRTSISDQSSEDADVAGQEPHFETAALSLSFLLCPMGVHETNGEGAPPEAYLSASEKRVCFPRWRLRMGPGAALTPEMLGPFSCSGQSHPPTHPCGRECWTLGQGRRISQGHPGHPPASVAQLGLPSGSPGGRGSCAGCLPITSHRESFRLAGGAWAKPEPLWLEQCIQPRGPFSAIQIRYSDPFYEDTN